MAVYLSRRIVQALLILLGVSVITFALLYLLPADPVRQIAGRSATPETVENIRRQLGLDDPVYMRFGAYMVRLAKGDFGTSFRTREPVTTMIAKRMWPTLQLIFAAMMFAIVIGVPLGFIAALRPGSIADTISMVVAVSAPTALAMRTADLAGITLVAIARDDGFEIFTHPRRIETSIAEHVA